MSPYGVFPARKHSPWIPDLHRGIMILSQTGITKTAFFLGPNMTLRREKYYKWSLSDENEPFKLMHFALPFTFLALGFLFSIVSFCKEKCKIKGV